MRRRLVSIALILAGCGGSELNTIEEVDDALFVASRDRPESIDVVSWNIEWLGSTREGPSDESLQLLRAREIIGGLDVDLVGLVEVVSRTSFEELVGRLPHHHGLLADDPRVERGAQYYGPNEQKVALIMRDTFEIERARLVLTEEASSFGGRPPMEVRLRFTVDGRPRTLTVVVAHFKAMVDFDSYRKRVRTAEALKRWLDTEHPSRWVLVAGDFNDDLDFSTYRGSVSPFKTIVDDSARYRFTTMPLTIANQSTTVGFAATIDHHLATNELALREVPNSAQVLRLDRFIPRYGETVSDHFPVLTRYDLR